MTGYDLVTTLAEAIWPLSDLVKWALTPRHIIKEAEAKNYASKQEADARLYAEKINLEIAEMQKKNTAQVLEKAKGHVLEDITESEIDSEWLANFFNETKNVSDEEMQEVFASILAGELEKPGSYSKRTLSVVRQLKAEEAQLFIKSLKYSVKTGGKILIITDMDAGLLYTDIVELEDAGLVKMNEQHFEITINKENTYLYGGLIGIVKSNNNSLPSQSIACMTKAGEELYELSVKEKWIEFDYEFFKKYMNSLKKEGTTVSIHQILSVEGNTINYSAVPLN